MPTPSVVSKVYEVSLRGPSRLRGAPEILRGLFERFGIKRTDIIVTLSGPIFKVSSFFQNKRRACDFKRQVYRLGLKGVSVLIKCLSRGQWMNSWKDTFHTFLLTQHIDIVPDWEKKKYRFNKRYPIWLNPGNAFGTGLHETTQFMARLIESKQGLFESFLDIGTGTGILAMVAAIGAARRVTAVDADGQSIDTARKNFLNNRISVDEVKRIELKNFTSKEKFDFVAANLITQTLISEGRKIASLVQENGYLAVSGISCDNVDELKRAYARLPLRLLKTIKGKYWVALLYRKSAKRQIKSNLCPN